MAIGISPTTKLTIDSSLLTIEIKKKVIKYLISTWAACSLKGPFIEIWNYKTGFGIRRSNLVYVKLKTNLTCP